MRTEFVQMRAEGALPAIARERHKALVVMPYTERALAERSARQLAARAGAEGLLLAVEDVERQGFIRIANRVFRDTTSEYFAYVAQDAFAGRQWLARGLAALQQGGGLLGFNDGKWAGLLAGFGLAARDWAAANYAGDLFWHEYARHYADAELTMLAMSKRRYVYDPNCVLVEVDWDKDGAAVHRADRELYRARAAGGFDGRVSDERLRKLFS
jgi:hypothetical protein